MRDIEQYGKDYNSLEFEKYQVKYRRKKVLEIIHKYQPRNILEIGCGMEPLFEFMKDSEYDCFTIIEPNETFYNNALAISKKKKKQIVCLNDFFKRDVKGLSSSYDMIICSSLMHEIEQPETFAKTIHDICNNNTIVHINVPNAKSFHRILAKMMGIIQSEYDLSEKNIMLQQKSVFDMERLVSIMVNSDFNVIENGSYFIKPFTHKQMQQMLDMNIMDETVLDGLYEMESVMPEFGSEIYVNCKIK